MDVNGMINDTPKSTKTQITPHIKAAKKPNYVKSTPQRDQNNSSKRSSTQSFTCG